MVINYVTELKIFQESMIRFVVCLIEWLSEDESIAWASWPHHADPCISLSPNPTWLSMGISNPRSAFDHRKLISIVRSDIFRWVEGSSWALSIGPLELLLRSRNFISRGLCYANGKKGWTWGRLRRRALDTHRRYMQNRIKTRFEHMYLRLRNFHRDVDLNIPTPLTMQRRIVSIRKMHFGDDHQFSLSIVNSIFTSYDKSVRF